MASVEAEGRRMASSQTLSSGLHVQSELLNEIATLRSALAQSKQQLDKAHAAGYVSPTSSSYARPSSALEAARRDRRVTMPAAAASAASSGQNIAGKQSHKLQYNNSGGSSASARPSMLKNTSSSSADQRHRRNSSAVVPSLENQRPASRATSSTTTRPATPRSATAPGPASSTGYQGAPPSSLATPTSASAPAFALRRDTAYDDLARVMNAPSPLPASRTSNGLGISSPPPPRRSSSMNSSGTPTSISKVPMPVIALGSVGTATTLAGGSNSPKTPLSASDKATFDGTPIRARPHANAGNDAQHAVPEGVLRDSTNASTRNSKHSNSPDDGDSDKLSDSTSTLGLPPLPHSMPSDMRSPHLSSDGECEYSPTTTMDSNDDEPKIAMRRQSKSSAGMSRGGSSPFFGGSAGFTERHAARIASSQSGTSKVIMSLQTDLTNSRTQLEHTRTQLRASARAVESLTRQIEDLKEGKERSRLELQGMSTTLIRRERMLEETLARARTAESNTKILEEEKRLHYGECNKKLKDLENRCREAEERRSKAESEYNAIKSSTSNLYGGFAKEVSALKKELKNTKLKNEQDRNDSRTRQQSITKLLASRNSAKEDVTTALQDLSKWQQSVQTKYQSTIDTLSDQYAQSQIENEVLARRTQEVLDELRQYKNAMRAYDDKLSASHS